MIQAQRHHALVAERVAPADDAVDVDGFAVAGIELDQTAHRCDP